jgi:hypothetical protein
VNVKSNLVPDFVEDCGHTFGSQLSDEEKLAPIQYVKTFSEITSY